jgi:hypothetical protein
MSINLNLTIDDNPFGLWQMPTRITYICMTTDDGVVHDRLRGKKAKAAIARYIAWVEGHKDGVFESAEDADENRQVVDDHINAIKSRLEKAKQVVVYMM